MSDLLSNYVVTKSGVNVIFSYLFAAGYLTLNGMQGFCRAPNKEVEEAFKERLLIHYDTVYSLSESLFRDVTDQLQKVFDANEDEEYKEAAVGIRKTLGKLFAAMPEFSKFDRYSIDDSDEEMLHGNEDLVHTILNYIALQLPGVSHFGTEVYLGKGRADMVILDKEQNKAVIVELKYDKGSAAGALKQIKTSDYSAPVPEGYQVIHLGVNVEHSKVVSVGYDLASSSSSLVMADLLSETTSEIEHQEVEIIGDDGVKSE